MEALEDTPYGTRRGLEGVAAAAASYFVRQAYTATLGSSADLASAMREASQRERTGRVVQHVLKRRKARLAITLARLRRDDGESEEEEDAVRALLRQLLACVTAAMDGPAMLLDVRDADEVEDK